MHSDQTMAVAWVQKNAIDRHNLRIVDRPQDVSMIRPSLERALHKLKKYGFVVLMAFVCTFLFFLLMNCES